MVPAVVPHLHHRLVVGRMTRTLRQITDDCARVNREIDLEQDPGYRRCVKAPRPNSPKHSRPQEILGQDPISGRCGVTAIIRKGAGRRRLAWLPCDQLSCGQCGPRLRRERTAYYLQQIGSQSVVARTVARSAWPTLRRRLGRAASNYLRFDTPTGDYLILATEGPGTPVTSLEAWLHEAFAQLPAGGRVSSTRAWALVRAEQAPSGWHLEGVSQLPVADVIQVARELDLYAGGGRLRACDDQRWQAFSLRIGLHRPDHHRWWSAAA